MAHYLHYVVITTHKYAPLLPIIERLGILLLVDILMLSVVDVAVVTVIINLSFGCVYRNSHFICFRYFRYLTSVLTVRSQLTGGGRWSRGLTTLQLDFNPRPDRAEHHQSRERDVNDRRENLWNS